LFSRLDRKKIFSVDIRNRVPGRFGKKIICAVFLDDYDDHPDDLQTGVIILPSGRILVSETCLDRFASGHGCPHKSRHRIRICGLSTNPDYYRRRWGLLNNLLFGCRTDYRRTCAEVRSYYYRAYRKTRGGLDCRRSFESSRAILRTGTRSDIFHVTENNRYNNILSQLSNRIPTEYWKKV